MQRPGSARASRTSSRAEHKASAAAAKEVLFEIPTHSVVRDCRASGAHIRPESAHPSGRRKMSSQSDKLETEESPKRPLSRGRVRPASAPLTRRRRRRRLHSYNPTTGRREAVGGKRSLHHETERTTILHEEKKPATEVAQTKEYTRRWVQGAAGAPRFGLGPLLPPVSTATGPTRPHYPTPSVEASVRKFLKVKQDGRGEVHNATGHRPKVWSSSIDRWREYANLRRDEILVTVEHCHNCHRHKMSTWHDESVFRQNVDAVENFLRGSSLESQTGRRIVVVSKGIDLDGKQKGGNVIGAFEVHVAAIGESGQVCMHMCHSKFATGCWPRLPTLRKRIEKALSLWGIIDGEGQLSSSRADELDSDSPNDNRRDGTAAQARGLVVTSRSGSLPEQHREAAAIEGQREELRVWLFARNPSLAQYVETLVSEGYDSRAALALLELEDAQLLPGVKRGHAKLLAAAASQLRAEMTPGIQVSSSAINDCDHSSTVVGKNGHVQQQAAIMLQAAERGRQGRKVAQDALERQDAAIKIQRGFRQMAGKAEEGEVDRMGDLSDTLGTAYHEVEEVGELSSKEPSLALVENEDDFFAPDSEGAGDPVGDGNRDVPPPDCDEQLGGDARTVSSGASDYDMDYASDGSIGSELPEAGPQASYADDFDEED
jgi:hypothetical protein